MEAPEPVLPASQLADWIDGLIARHGDAPLLQGDNDTGTDVCTDPGCVTIAGPRIVVGNRGYDHGPTESMAASAFVAELRQAIAEHGDLPVYQKDADTRMLIAFTEQHEDHALRGGGFRIYPESYAEAHERASCATS